MSVILNLGSNLASITVRTVHFGSLIEESAVLDSTSWRYSSETSMSHTC